MKLTTENGRVLRDPGAGDLEGALGTLGMRGNGYAILEGTPDHYLQVAGSKADGYAAEYREGGEQTHNAVPAFTRLVRLATCPGQPPLV